MHVVGAQFGRRELARAALAELRARFSLGPRNGAVRRLGSTEYHSPAEHYLLAARLEDHEVAKVLAAIRARGGAIVELRTGPELGTFATGPSPASERRVEDDRPARRRPRPPRRVSR